MEHDVSARTHNRFRWQDSRSQYSPERLTGNCPRVPQAASCSSIWLSLLRHRYYTVSQVRRHIAASDTTNHRTTPRTIAWHDAEYWMKELLRLSEKKFEGLHIPPPLPVWRALRENKETEWKPWTFFDFTKYAHELRMAFSPEKSPHMHICAIDAVSSSSSLI